MNFSYAKLTTLRPQKEKRLKTFLIAMAVAAAFLLPTMFLSEGYFTFYGDFNVQQIPFYKHCHSAIRSGNIGWDWGTDLGANFIGSYTFYLLGSPFFWLTIPFPTDFVPYLMGPLLILKFACAALTAYMFIRRFTRTADAAMLGGLLYAFSGFSIYNVFYNHFHEAIIVFPLLLFAIEMLIVENRRGVFALAVALAAVTNYFFFFGMVVFTVIYYFVRLFSGAFRFRLWGFVTLIFEAVLGVALAAFLLMPSYMAVSSNSRISEVLLGWNAITYDREQIYLNIIECFFFPPDIPARPVFFPDAEVRWSSLGGWLPVFSMVGVFVWFMNRPKTWLKRVMGICIFMAMVPVLNSAFYAFNYAYYARWFYMPILMMCLATVMLTEDRTVDWKPGFRWTIGITAAFALVIGLFPQKNDKGDIVLGLFSDNYFTEEYTTLKLFGKKIELPFDLTYFVRFWVTVALAAIGLVLMGILIRTLRKNRTKFYRNATVMVCIVSVVYANFFMLCGRSHSISVKDSLIPELIEGEIFIEDDEEFRIDVYKGSDNTGMYLGYPCINAFHSVVPSSITEFYEYIGADRVVASRPGEPMAAIRPLLSVKYLVDSTTHNGSFSENGKTKLPAFKYVKTTGGYDLYENLNYVPYGFSYENYMSYDFCDSYDEDDRASMMLKAILLDDTQIKRYSYMLENIEDNEDGSLDISDKAMAKDSSKLKETSAYEFSIDNGGFTAKVERDEPNLVFFSVPYDEGWTATVNGEAVKVEKVNVGFMAVAVPAGDSTIRFEYKTPGLTVGLAVSGGAVVVLVAYMLLWQAFKKRRAGDTAYPEGTALLEEWQKQDIAEAAERSMELETEEEELELPPLTEPDSFEGGFRIDSSLFSDDDE